jgi:hypothetical protein
MATTVQNGQTCLEKRGIAERNNEIVRSDYNINDEYNEQHKDALSDGDPQGKGTGSAGHGHWLPDCTKPTNMIDYSNFDTANGGGSYDIEGRNGVGGRKASMTRSIYNAETPYGSSIVDTSINQTDGQYVMQ